ncbi:MAG: hypothetical protein WBV94_15505 [Blastocatellia bacterium]
MKKLVVVVVLLCLGAFVCLKKAHPLSFTVETKKGQKIQVTKLLYEATAGLGAGVNDFSVYLDVGHFKVHNDLQDIKCIKVLDNDSFNLTLEVTDTSGKTIEGKRSDSQSPLREYASDWISGESGKVHVFLSLSNIVSITRD